jgi:large subunit ribosomal protein L6e
MVRKTGSRNDFLVRGVERFSRSAMYHKRGIWAKKAKNALKKIDAQPSKSNAAAPKTVSFGKNGKRTVLPNERRYPTEDIATPLPNRRRQNPTRLRSSIQPGQVLVILAGRFKGRRVVFLKQLASGLLLVTGMSAPDITIFSFFKLFVK